MSYNKFMFLHSLIDYMTNLCLNSFFLLFIKPSCNSLHFYLSIHTVNIIFPFFHSSFHIFFSLFFLIYFPSHPLNCLFGTFRCAEGVGGVSQHVFGDPGFCTGQGVHGPGVHHFRPGAFQPFKSHPNQS